MKYRTIIVVITALLLSGLLYQMHESSILVHELVNLKTHLLKVEAEMNSYKLEKLASDVVEIDKNRELIKNIIMCSIVIALIGLIGFTSYKLYFILISSLEGLINNVSSTTEISIYNILTNLGIKNELRLQLKDHHGVDFLVNWTGEKIEILVQQSENHIMTLAEYIDLLIVNNSDSILSASRLTSELSQEVITVFTAASGTGLV
jgi:hypothetical protein